MSTRLKDLGLDKKEMSHKVNVMDEKTIIESIEQLESMPIKKFNKLLLVKSETIVDKKIKIISNEKCSKVKDCKSIAIDFDVLFNYEIGGFRTNNYFHSLIVKTLEDRSKLFVKDRILRRKGGIFHLNIKYYHHTTFCGSSYIGSTIKRTPFSLLLPNYRLFVEKGIKIETILEYFELLREVRNNNKPSLSTLEELTNLFNVKQAICLSDHSDDFCSDTHNEEDEDDYCDYAHYDSAADYCENNCSLEGGFNFLGIMLTHPHFFANMDNFCTGSQFSSNPVFVELQKFPNPISYIGEMIRMTNDIHLQDSYYSDRYMGDVFNNFHIFNIWNRTLNRLLEQSSYYSKERNNVSYKTIDSSKDHCLTPDCYCMDCTVFKYWLHNGLKYDPSKLIFGVTPEVDFKQFEKVLEYHYRNDAISNAGLSAIINQAKIDITSEKYQFSGKSQFDQLNMGFQTKNFYVGLFTNIKSGKIELIQKDYIDSLHSSYNKIINLSQSITLFNENAFTEKETEILNESFPILRKCFEQFKEKSIYDYFLSLYKQVKFDE